ncbi:putative receptor [Klebsiella pneumoniae]|uniref:Putative receptor n=1 Tax=Klebsiella pneumoniae TaxID=573 RepID=A0A2X1SQD4_KLEPN|nr:putative receptor [Klebsiella pneumoniae]
MRPLQPRELAVNEQTNTVYITGLGKESVIWVVDGATLKLKNDHYRHRGQWRRVWRSIRRLSVCIPPTPTANC